MAGTSFEQFKRSLGNPVARKAIGFDLSDVEAQRILSDEGLSRAYYDNWLRHQPSIPPPNPATPPGVFPASSIPVTPPSPRQHQPSAIRANPLGAVALALAILGGVFACFPATLIPGEVVLGVAFVLGIIAICLPNRRWGVALSAVIVAPAGAIFGLVVVGIMLGFGMLSDSPLPPAVATEAAKPSAPQPEAPQLTEPEDTAPSWPEGFEDTGEGLAIRFLENPSCGEYIRCSQVEVFALRDCPNAVYIEANMIDAKGRNIGLTNDVLGALDQGDRGLLDMVVFNDSASRVELSEISCY